MLKFWRSGPECPGVARELLGQAPAARTLCAFRSLSAAFSDLVPCSLRRAPRLHKLSLSCSFFALAIRVTHLSVAPVTARVLLAYPRRFEQEKQALFCFAFSRSLHYHFPSYGLTWGPNNVSVRPVGPR